MELRLILEQLNTMVCHKPSQAVFTIILQSTNLQGMLRSMLLQQ